MFPGVDGFHWTAGHVIFLSLFFVVAATIATMVASATVRTVNDFRTHRAIDLCWKTEFSELPVADRRCRHELAGRVQSRTCDNAFDCQSCTNYSQFADLPAKGISRCTGLNYPDDRFYHRGHTWVMPAADGTCTIGLDDFADHLIGKPDSVEMPDVGTEIELNQTAWQMTKNGNEIRVRAPIEGTVVGLGGSKDGWFLKVRPRMDLTNPQTMRHLLRGPEINGWISTELGRLQVQLRQPDTVPALADGGMLLPNLMETISQADWDAVLADTFLES
jgi:hypothetical protein